LRASKLSPSSTAESSAVSSASALMSSAASVAVLRLIPQL